MDIVQACYLRPNGQEMDNHSKEIRLTVMMQGTRSLVERAIDSSGTTLQIW